MRRPRELRQAVVNLPTQEANWGAHVLAGGRGWAPGSPTATWECGPHRATSSHSLIEARNLNFTVKFLDLKYPAIQAKPNRSAAGHGPWLPVCDPWMKQSAGWNSDPHSKICLKSLGNKQCLPTEVAGSKELGQTQQFNPDLITEPQGSLLPMPPSPPCLPQQAGTHPSGALILEPLLGLWCSQGAGPGHLHLLALGTQSSGTPETCQ